MVDAATLASHTSPSTFRPHRRFAIVAYIGAFTTTSMCCSHLVWVPKVMHRRMSGSLTLPLPKLVTSL